MVTSLLLPLVAMAVVVSPTVIATASANTTNPDLAFALEEMQKANYFAYAMLINMAPPDLIQSNITFLMPNDKSLSKTNALSETSVTDFLLSHSIPWPLLFENMAHFPTGSMILTSRPGFALKVTNDGIRHFFLNNARIVSPNICAKTGSSIRCHGVDGVVQPALFPQSCPQKPPPPPPPPPSPPNATIYPTTPSPSLPASPSPQPPAPSVEIDHDSPSKSSSGSYPLMSNKVVASLAAMLCFIL